jgi:hypothetical protein
MLMTASTEQGGAKMNDSHIGSSLDEFLKEEGIYEEITAIAIQRVWHGRRTSIKRLGLTNGRTPVKTTERAVFRRQMLDSGQSIPMMQS